jgi:hypothetical protein
MAWESMVDDSKHFGRWLRSRRKLLDLTQHALAEQSLHLGRAADHKQSVTLALRTLGGIADCQGKVELNCMVSWQGVGSALYNSGAGRYSLADTDMVRRR